MKKKIQALEWLKANKRNTIVDNAFNGSQKEAIKFINLLLKAGATQVEVANAMNDFVYVNDDSDKKFTFEYADTLIIHLPKTLSKRIDIMALIFELYRPDSISSSLEKEKEVDWKKDDKIVLWWD